MAKKFGKALFFTAIAGAIAAGGVAIYNKYKASTDDFDDDFLDFDDEEDDFDDFDEEDDEKPSEEKTDREYVSIPRENTKDDGVKVNVDVKIAEPADDMFETEEDTAEENASDTAAGDAE